MENNVTPDDLIEAIKDNKCIPQLRDLLACMENNKSKISVCQNEFSILDKCTLETKSKTFWENLNETLIHNRFFTDSDEFGRKDGPISNVAKAVLPNMFDEDVEKKPSSITKKLQKNFPRVFKDDDEDDD
eukprot:TRINITY_DN2208_c0_g1_i1.p1 TRINITY_DN2208_c0_g1~~TRINITY_DN2208_c0_g1_i1.p1  ORF type:complete len:130 (+),score=39.69 TRINITY_DN2208_c0_g1_i1:53-442(+)